VINVKNKGLVKAIGEKIRSLRTQKGISQEELANEAEVPLSQIGRIERGENNPTISTLHVIAKALEVELKVLVDIKNKI
jgi:transcriptional regulator with XRE-family HTH domain